MFYSANQKAGTYNFIFSEGEDPVSYMAFSQSCKTNKDKILFEMARYYFGFVKAIKMPAPGGTDRLHVYVQFFDMSELGAVALVASTQKLNPGEYFHNTLKNLEYNYIDELDLVSADVEGGIQNKTDDLFSFAEILESATEYRNSKEANENLGIEEEEDNVSLPSYYRVDNVSAALDLSLPNGNLYDCGAYFVIHTSAMLDDFFPHMEQLPASAKLIGTFSLQGLCELETA